MIHKKFPEVEQPIMEKTSVIMWIPASEHSPLSHPHRLFVSLFSVASLSVMEIATPQIIVFTFIDRIFLKLFLMFLNKSDIKTIRTHLPDLFLT